MILLIYLYFFGVGGGLIEAHSSLIGYIYLYYSKKVGVEQ